MASLEGPSARKYRSRKEKPCDNCRRRRVCCVRDAEGDCALCSRRSIPCTFSSAPSPRKRRAGSATQSREPTQVRQDFSNAVGQIEGSGPRNNGGEGKYVGLSGTDDVYFVVDRQPAIGNDPAREAYFKVCFNPPGENIVEYCADAFMIEGPSFSIFNGVLKSSSSFRRA
jgi:hypothetical protein